VLSVIKGLTGGAVGFAFGAGLMTVVRAVAGAQSAWDFETAAFGGWLFGLLGWLLGVGVWEHWVRRWFGRPLAQYTATGWRRYFSFDTDHKVIGIQYLVTFLFMFFLAGLFAMLMRMELAGAGRGVLESPSTYNTVMSLHGTTMIFVAVAATSGAFGNYVVPLMIGARDMAFPKLNALSYWLVPPVIFLLIGAFLAGGYDTGWTGYPPLATTNASGQLFFGLAFFTLGLSSILGAINFLTTIIRMRAPGMRWTRLPIFVWAIFCTALLAAFFTQFVGVAMLMVILDRVAGTAFFAADAGGAPLLYQHIFWFYSHPAVYIMILPAFGITLEILPHFSRKPLFAYKWAVVGLIGITGMSMTVWAHHMFTTGISDTIRAPFLATTEMISIPTGLIFLAALGTLWQGRLRLKVPMLFALAVLFNFLIGGLTGVFLADVPVDIQLQDTYFVVGHLHYVILGGGIFGLFAAIYYWFPKMTGRMYSERLGRIHFWWMFLGFNLTFLPMFILGLSGMNRRIAEYLPELESTNRIVSIAGFFLGASFVVFLWNYIRSWARGPVAEANPWRIRTLEWQTSSPPPHENFDGEPVIIGDPYGYGGEGPEHVQFEPVGASSPVEGGS
jgi:cytochrome c oxidase subunit 1